MSTVDPLISRGFRRGAAAAEEAAASTTRTRLMNFFNLKDGARVFLRMITPPSEWITVDVHTMYDTKPQPSGYQGKWPQTMSPVCRNTKMGDGLPMFADGCYCCEHPRLDDKGKPRKPSARTFAIAVLRDEVMGDNTPATNNLPPTQRAGFRYAQREVPELDAAGNPTGKTTHVYDVVLIEQGWKLFYSHFESIQQIFGSITNQEISVGRKGAGMNDTSYQIVGLGLSNKDMADPIELAKFGITLEGKDAEGYDIYAYPEHYSHHAEISRRASDDFYALFIDPTKEAPERGGSAAEAGPVKDDSKNEASKATVAQMASRIMKLPGQEPEAPSVPAVEAPAGTASLD